VRAARLAVTGSTQLRIEEPSWAGEAREPVLGYGHVSRGRRCVFYLELFRALKENDVRYVVVGGLAVNLHGAGRLTHGVDVLVPTGAENVDRLATAAGRLQAYAQPDFEAIYARRMELEVDGVRVPTASIDDLIAMKTGTGRLIDHLDVQALQAIVAEAGSAGQPDDPDWSHHQERQELRRAIALTALERLERLDDLRRFLAMVRRAPVRQTGAPEPNPSD
jgi:hypothetical protein